MATSGKKAAKVTDSRKFEPLIRDQSGAIMPRKPWRLYAEDSLAPLRRQSRGAITPTTKWLHYGDDSQVVVPRLSPWTSVRLP
jgi:hypothetical protein